MIVFDAVTPPNPNSVPETHPKLHGHRVTDLSATVGSAVWLSLVTAASREVLDLTVVELFVCLALLLLVPLGLGLAATPRQSGGRPLLYTIAVFGQFPAAVATTAALTLPVRSIVSVVLVLPWLGVTSVIAAFGLWRLLSRGLGPLPELAVDAAMFYIPVAAIALLLHRAGISLRFEPIIILLTAVHYHYAGFVLPLVAGLAGRIVAEDTGQFSSDLAGRVAAVTTFVIIVNIAVIAVGITFSPLVELIAVAFFTVAVAVFAILLLQRIVPTIPRVPAALISVASLAIFASMALALAYGYSAFPRTPTVVSIGEMIRWHGSLNAFAFSIPALIAFRLLEN